MPLERAQIPTQELGDQISQLLRNLPEELTKVPGPLDS